MRASRVISTTPFCETSTLTAASLPSAPATTSASTTPIPPAIFLPFSYHASVVPERSRSVERAVRRTSSPGDECAGESSSVRSASNPELSCAPAMAGRYAGLTSRSARSIHPAARELFIPRPGRPKARGIPTSSPRFRASAAARVRAEAILRRRVRAGGGCGRRQSFAGGCGRAGDPRRSVSGQLSLLRQGFGGRARVREVLLRLLDGEYLRVVGGDYLVFRVGGDDLDSDVLQPGEEYSLPHIR